MDVPLIPILVKKPGGSARINMNGKPELTIEYLAQGVPIVLEKPFALTIVCKQKTPN
jgi:hypothetical protein